jgi:hypothetical protein
VRKTKKFFFFFVGGGGGRDSGRLKIKIKKMFYYVSVRK